MSSLSKKELRDQYKNRTLTGGVYCITCHGNSQFWLGAAPDIQGFQNRFAFSQKTDSAPELYMKEAWALYGASSFSCDILEQLKKQETQTDREFADDLAILLDMWKEKYQGNYSGQGENRQQKEEKNGAQ